MADNLSTYTIGDARFYFQSHRAHIEADLAAHVARFIDETQTSLDCAIYDLRSPVVVEALVNAARQRKRLRIAYDASKEHLGGMMADPKPSGALAVLESSGLLAYATPVHEGRQLMHDKFLVRDGHEVWTGSANFTSGGFEHQDNNCLAIPSPALAAAYTATFEELLADEHADTNARGAPASLHGMALKAYFSPASGVHIEHVVARLLQSARRVRVLAFLLSDAGILGALLPMGRDAHFDIRGVYDPHGMQNVLRYSKQDPSHFWFLHDPRFVAAPTHAFRPDAEEDFMHNKVMILDDRTVITGSYNFSENAESNDENLLVIESPEVAAAYARYFEALYVTYGGTLAPAHAATITMPAKPRPQGPPQREESHMMGQPGSIRAHVLQLRARTAGPFALAASKSKLAGETQVGSTPHVVVFSDGSADGNAAARAVLAAFEADFAAITAWFGGIQLPPGHPGDDQTTPRTALPIHVAMDPQAGGAYHFGCDGTDVYVEPQPQVVTGLVVAEVVEIFEAAINNGWNCGQTNGESLSRVLAVERNSGLASLTAQTAQTWWANGHADYVTTNNATDTNQDANGCGSLFVYYLHSQLGYSYEKIATTGGASLGACYQGLSGKAPAQGFSDFVARLATIASGGQLTLPASGNPFPIAATAQPMPTSGASGGAQPVSGAPSLPALPSAGGGAGAPFTKTIIALVVLIVLVAIALIGALVQALRF